MTDADNRPDLEPGFEAEEDAATSSGAPERKAFAGGTEIGGRRRTSRPLTEDESLVLAGVEVAQEQAAHLREVIHERRDQARERIREQPLAAVVATFAGGLILGLLLARR